MSKKKEVVPEVVPVPDQRVISSKVTEVYAKRFRHAEPVVPELVTETELPEQAVNAKGEEI